MAGTEFVAPDSIAARKRYVVSLAYCAGACIFATGIVVWCTWLLQQPNINRLLKNQLAVWFLLVAFGILLFVFLRQSFRLLFEIESATREGNCLLVRYRCLSEKVVLLPYAGRVVRNVKLPQLTSDTGFRVAHVAARGAFDRMLIPSELAGSNELIELLGRKNVVL